MIQKWKSSDDEFNVRVEECEFNFKSVTLPVLTNLDVSSEETLIQIKYIYNKYFELIHKTLGMRMTKIDKMPYETILKLNFVARMLYDYSMKFTDPGHKYDLFGVDCSVNMDPAVSTPFCEYVYSAVIEKINVIENELKQRGLSMVQEVYSDTDWWS